MRDNLGPADTDDLPPHSPEAERGVLGCCLRDISKAAIAIKAGVGRRWFYELKHAELWGAIATVVTDGGGDFLKVALRLREAGKLDEVGGHAYLNELHECVPSAENLEYYLPELRDRLQRRIGLEALPRLSAILKDPLIDSSSGLADVESLIERFRACGAGNVSYAALDERLFNPALTPPLLRPVYSLGGIPISTRGNLTNVIAAVKAGKTGAIGAQIACVIKEFGSKCDTLGFESENPHGFALLHFDSEQSKDDFWWVVNRAMKRAGVPARPPWLESYFLTGLGAFKAQAFVRTAMKRAAEVHGGLHSVLIDGWADLVRDVNDAAEVNEFVAQFHGLAIEYDCPIVGVLHLNPGTDKSRGHLGSQLERKAETNLLLEKDGAYTEIWSAKQRRAPILKGHGPRFQWDATAGMHVLVECSHESRLAAKIEPARNAAEDVFNGHPSMRFADLASTIKTRLRVSAATAERRIGEWQRFGVIEKSVAGLYVLKA